MKHHPHHFRFQPLAALAVSLLLASTLSADQPARQKQGEAAAPLPKVLLIGDSIEPELFSQPGDVHFSSSGYDRIAKQVGEAIEAALAGTEPLVAQTHAASLKLREESLRRTIAKQTCWPGGTWGENLWCLAALYLNEKVDEANARLLEQANGFLASKPATVPPTSPENHGRVPWTFFSVTDYVRTLCLFHSKSPQFPGRLKPETEAAMKESLWLWISGECRLADAQMDDLFLLLGTENHDLNRRPSYYLVTSLLKDDPAYRDRKLADGHITAEHADAYTNYFREWPRRRAQTGLWAEVGSNTYQKYSWPALFNLHELAPDPLIRHRFGLLLDLAFIEEAQLSVNGRRGGGRSRADYGPHPFQAYKNLLHAVDGRPAGSSHSRVIETSRYQLPAEAILLAARESSPAGPVVIRNRVLGELAEPGQDQPDHAGGQRLAADSALVNYAYRTPHYLLGSTLQNPALSMTDPDTGAPVLKYAGISRQKRTCGLLFDNPASPTISQVHPVVEDTAGGRPQHSFWSVQHENVLLLQRIAARKNGALGSYSTGKLGIRFDGSDLEKIDEGGWIFASNGNAFVGVKFLDGGHLWDEKKTEAHPATFAGPGDTTRILLHAGDLASHPSFERFRATVRDHSLQVTADKVDYRFGARQIEMTRYDAAAPETFTLPRIDGHPLDLRPTAAYHGPVLNGQLGDDRITVTVGSLRRVLDFSATGP